MRRPWGQILALGLGLFLFLWILARVGLEETLAQVGHVGWRLPLLLLPSFLMNVLFTLGWWWTLPPGVPFGSLFLIRAAGEAVNTVTPLAYLGGEPLKASLLRRLGISWSDGLASVVVAKTLTSFAYCLFIFLGLATALLRTGEFSSALVGGTGVGLLLAASITLVYYSQTRGLFSLLHRLVYWLGFRGEAWTTKREMLEILDAKILMLYRSGNSLSGCLLFKILGWLASPLETYFFVRALGIPMDLLTAIVVQALVFGVKVATVFVPGGLGAQEGGNVLIFVGLGMTGEVGLAYSLLRRFREIAWTLIGFAVLPRFGWGPLKTLPEVEKDA